jgi:hypothetical protein
VYNDIQYITGMVLMAVYVCNKCLFCFERAGAADSCPDCGKTGVRDATIEEIAEYERNKAERRQALQEAGN